MFKKLNKKGFTLAELLIVVAIIGILVAISIPIFTSQLRKARLATNQANARAAYAAAVADRLDKETTGAEVTYKYVVATAELTKASGGTNINKTPSEWNLIDNEALGNDTAIEWYVTFNTNDTFSFAYKMGE